MGRRRLRLFCFSAERLAHDSQSETQIAMWASPREAVMQYREHKAVIDSCTRCAIECEMCLAHDMEVGDRMDCARANMDCARACWEAASALARDSGFSVHYCGHCAALCDGCAEVCGQYQDEHCKRCAEACRDCARACRSLAHSEVGA